MSTQAVRGAAAPPPRAIGESTRVAFLGARARLDACAPPAGVSTIACAHFASDDGLRFDELEAFRPDVTVVLDPAAAGVERAARPPGVSLGVLPSGLPEPEHTQALEHLDRIVSHDPALTGTAIGARSIWRAIPPPVSDLFYRAAARGTVAPRAMTIGRSTEHREAMLMPAKHHHDLLQVIHGISGQRLHELLGGYDVGVFIAPEQGGAFGHQVGLHLAAGQLLLSEELRPRHGLERNIDYLQVESPDELVWVLERMRRFPEMHHGIRVRGHLKAEQFRASLMFARVVHDLLADVSAFGPAQPR